MTPDSGVPCSGSTSFAHPLPAGTYKIEANGRAARLPRASAQPFNVEADSRTGLDVRFDTGYPITDVLPHRPRSRFGEHKRIPRPDQMFDHFGQGYCVAARKRGRSTAESEADAKTRDARAT